MSESRTSSPAPNMSDVAPASEPSSPLKEIEAVTFDVETAQMDRLAILLDVKRTQMEMMLTRGYNLTPFDLLVRDKVQSVRDFWRLLSEHAPSLVSGGRLGEKKQRGCIPPGTEMWYLLSGEYAKRDNPQVLNYVAYLPPPANKAFPSGYLKDVVARVKSKPNIRFLDVIYEYPMRKANIAHVAASRRLSAIWMYSDLLIPFPEYYYPARLLKVLTPAEITVDYGDDHQFVTRLPRILADDKQVRYYQIAPGSVVRMEVIIDFNVAIPRAIVDYYVSFSTGVMSAEAVIDSSIVPS